MKVKLIEIFIKLLLLGLPEYRKTVTNKEEDDGFLSQLWESNAFRKRVAERDAKIIFTMAGGEGLAPEPRDAYALHLGQRVENLLWARDAKNAHLRLLKEKQGQKVVS